MRIAASGRFRLWGFLELDAEAAYIDGGNGARILGLVADARGLFEADVAGSLAVPRIGC